VETVKKQEPVGSCLFAQTGLLIFIVLSIPVPVIIVFIVLPV
jgi:hypothetical protein